MTGRASTPTAPPRRKPHDPSAPEYVLGTDQQEAARLGLQHRLWSAAAHELWERAGVQPGMTVLDIGCGPGHATVELAQIVGPRGRVLGLDESATFLKQLNDEGLARRMVNIDRVLGDAHELDTLIPTDDFLDMAYARWVLCFLARPEDVVRSAARLLKRGGRLVIQDYFNYESMTVAPKREEFSRVIRAVAKSWRDRGGDPDIVARLPAMFRRHGLRMEHLAVRERLATPGSTMWHWPDSFWRSYVPRLVEAGQITEAERGEFEACWEAASADPDAFMVLPPLFDVIAVKE